MNSADDPNGKSWEDEVLSRLAGEPSGSIVDDEIGQLKFELDALAEELSGFRLTGDDAIDDDCRHVIEQVKFISEHVEDSKSEARANQDVAPKFLGQYELLAKLGQGGMGAVYKARHMQLDRTVALKMLTTQRLNQAGSVRRFRREIRAVGKLNHPNIVAALDAGEVNGVFYLAMEYVDGFDLGTVLRHHGPLSEADACEVIRQAAIGLSESHAQSMVHRDIKPSNLMLCLDREGQPSIKILDMGLALLSDHAGSEAGLTASGQLMGTIDYMAPEQCDDSRAVDIRADLYSLGSTLYALLTGAPPFSDKSLDTTIKKLLAVASQSPPPIESRRSDLSEPVISLVNRLLEKERSDRPSAPGELIDAIAPLCVGHKLDELLEQAPERSMIPLESISSMETVNQLSSPSVDTSETFEAHFSFDEPIPAIPAKANTAWPKSFVATLLVAIVAVFFGALLWRSSHRPSNSSKLSAVSSVAPQSQADQSDDRTKVSAFDFPSGLIAYWPMDEIGEDKENANRFVRDFSGSGFDAMSIGGSPKCIASGAPVPGKRGSLRFPADGGHLSVEHNACWESAQLTIATWLGMSTVMIKAGRVTLFRKGDSNSGFLVECCGKDSKDAGRLRFNVIRPDQKNDTIETTSRVCDGSWHHIAITVNHSRAALFVDGVQEASIHMPSSMPVSEMPLMIGDENGKVNRARLDEVAIYNRSLSLEEVQFVMRNKLAPNPAIAPLEVLSVGESQAAWGRHLEVPVEKTNSIGMALRLIPPGEFTMGSTLEELERVKAKDKRKGMYPQFDSEMPAHRVRITRPFYLGEFEVTQGEFELVMSANPSGFPSNDKEVREAKGKSVERYPAENFSWVDAVRFCNRLSEVEGLEPYYRITQGEVAIDSGNGYRLPTEAQWEYACRAGTTGAWSFPGGDGERYEWTINSNGVPHGVGMKKPNAFGLHDMHGNVFEWCQDWYSAEHYAALADSIAADPQGPSDGTRKVFRGGSFYQRRTCSRSAFRGNHFPSFYFREHGLRVVLPL